MPHDARTECLQHFVLLVIVPRVSLLLGASCGTDGASVVAAVVVDWDAIYVVQGADEVVYARVRGERAD